MQIRELIAKGDNRAAVGMMSKEYGDYAYSFIYRIVNDRQTALDVLQQTYLEAMRDLQRYGGRSSVKTWLLGIANHRALDAVRKFSRDRGKVSTDELEKMESSSPEASSDLDDRRMKAALDDCMKDLSPHVRSALLSRYQRGLSYEEMSEETSEKPGTLQARVTRALPVLRECLEGKGFFKK